MNFIQSILNNPNSIVDYPLIDNPQLDNLESLPLSDIILL